MAHHAKLALPTLCAALGTSALPFPSVAQDLPRVEAAPECFVQAPDTLAANGGMDCGYVVVPQNRANGPDGEARLAYLRIRSAGEAVQPPLFMLAGGPGQTLIKDDMLLLFQPQLLGPALANRDVVLMEQRGTYRSKPSLDCPEALGVGLEALTAGLDSRSAEKLSLERLRACIDRHKTAGVDFASYNNVESAGDVDDMRAALGYDRIVYYGSSYATLLGEYVMRLYPDSLAAVILDGTETQTMQSWIESRAINAQWGIDNLTRLCTDQPGCNGAYDLPALVDAALDLFNDGPITLSVPLPEGTADTTEVEVTVTAGDLAEQIYGLQTSKYGVAALPAELMQLVAGGREAVGEALGTAGVTAAAAAHGSSEIEEMLLMHAAMVCSDDPVHSLDEIRTEGAGRYATLFANTAGKTYVDLCALIDVPQLPNSFDADVISDIPTLVLSGGLDVQTPYFQSEKVVESLSNATHVIFPAGLHVQIANVNRCATRVLLSFLAAPESTPDTACAAEEQPLPFVLPDALEEQPD